MATINPQTPVPDDIAVIGAGSIGTAWAIVFARAGDQVRLHDLDPARLELARETIGTRLSALAAFDLLEEPPETVGRRIRYETDLPTALSKATYVQECVPEDLAIKREVFAQLDDLAAPTTILAGSSSAIPISKVTESLKGRHRCLIAHPGNPPYLLPIVELVPAPWTSTGTVERAAALLNGAQMSPVCLRREIEGFVFNRLQGAVLREAYCLVRDGVATVADIDRIMREGLGRRWSVVGPFEAADLNVRGGIGAHADRMGKAYARMGAERGQDDPWTADLVADVASQRRTTLPLDQWNDRVAWRDRELMAMARCQAQRDRGAAG